MLGIQGHGKLVQDYDSASSPREKERIKTILRRHVAADMRAYVDRL